MSWSSFHRLLNSSEFIKTSKFFIWKCPSGEKILLSFNIMNNNCVGEKSDNIQIIERKFYLDWAIWISTPRIHFCFYCDTYVVSCVAIRLLDTQGDKTATMKDNYNRWFKGSITSLLSIHIRFCMVYRCGDNRILDLHVMAF